MSNNQCPYCGSYMIAWDEDDEIWECLACYESFKLIDESLYDDYEKYDQETEQWDLWGNPFLQRTEMKRND
jgi:DNA-directed RNA polymerase subunit M/transcription elongation factor TFIIS